MGRHDQRQCLRRGGGDAVVGGDTEVVGSGGGSSARQVARRRQRDAAGQTAGRDRERGSGHDGGGQDDIRRICGTDPGDGKRSRCEEGCALPVRVTAPTHHTGGLIRAAVSRSERDSRGERTWRRVLAAPVVAPAADGAVELQRTGAVGAGVEVEI